jgi:hypothetical protein
MLLVLLLLAEGEAELLTFRSTKVLKVLVNAFLICAAHVCS